nr:membrane steroid-binding protein 1-like isoform X1 [Ipomoea trifida]
MALNLWTPLTKVIFHYTGMSSTAFFTAMIVVIYKVVCGMFGVDDDDIEPDHSHHIIATTFFCLSSFSLVNTLESQERMSFSSSPVCRVIPQLCQTVAIWLHSMNKCCMVSAAELHRGQVGSMSTPLLVKVVRTGSIDRAHRQRAYDF